ncbi:MAG TPA: sensor histidine kinase [Burkholderiales bacterium]|nr:sensor histidine kinase [Burkholderiales bacterium]
MLPKTKPVSLQRHFVGLVIVALLPLAVFAGLVATGLVEEQTAAQRARVEERTTALLSAVEQAVQSQITALQAITASTAWQRGDPAFLREHLWRLLATQPQWSTINVARTDGQQILNLLIRPGDPLPKIPGEDAGLQWLLRDRNPVVGDLVLGPSTDVLDFAVRTLVTDAKGETLVLSAVVRPESLDKVIGERELPAGWLAVVLDRNNRIVARSSEVNRFRGSYTSDTLRARLARASSGWNEAGVTLEGVEVQSYFRRSPVTGWAVALAVPASAFSASARHAALLLASGFVLALLVGFAAAFLLARRVSRPIRALAVAAEDIRHSRTAEVPANLRIRELDVLSDALRLAAGSLQERAELAKREYDALKAADAAKDRFLAMLAHELRNPLSALRAAAHALQVGAMDPARANDILRRQTEQMTRLIDDLLDVGRIAAGTFSVWAEPVNLSELLDEVLESFSLAGRTSGHQLRIQREDDVWVSGDPTRLRQVLWNLLDNAVKFTPNGKQIEVRLRTDGEEALVDVLDQGPGVDASEANRIFGLFVRGRSSTEGTAGGLGVGLALVKRIVELHGGMVTVTSGKHGHGSRFRVRLPAPAPSLKVREAGGTGKSEAS